MMTSLHDQYSASTRKKVLVLVLLAAVLVLLIIYSAKAGTVKVGFRDIVWSFTGHADADSMTSYILQQVRFPRMVMAILTGMSLAVAGVIMQAILRNPLASPFTLGVSSGASFGAALAIVLGASLFGIEQVIRSARWLIAVNAFLFGCLAVFIVYGLARLKNSSTTVLLLAGVAIGHLFSSGVSALKYFSNNEALKDLVVWLMGGFWGANWEVIGLLAPSVVVVFVILMLYAWDLNVLGMGEEVAKTAGVKVKQMRLVTLLSVTFIASATIAFSGVIGFIGLVAPHISRMMIGVDHRYLLPASCLSGAILLLASDTVARTILSPVEIPVGIITSIIGAPFFIYLLVKKRRDFWN